MPQRHGAGPVRRHWPRPGAPQLVLQRAGGGFRLPGAARVLVLAKGGNETCTGLSVKKTETQTQDEDGHDEGFSAGAGGGAGGGRARNTIASLSSGNRLSFLSSGKRGPRSWPHGPLQDGHQAGDFLRLRR